jgi:hypothetical protein
MGPEEEVDPVRGHQTGRGAHRECLGTKRLRQDGAVALDQMLRSGLEVVSGGVAARLLARWVAARRKTAGRDVMAGPIADDNSLAGQAALEVHRRAADDLEWRLALAVRVAMVDVADRVALDSAALAGQWASTVGEGPGPADAVEAECATALDRAGLPEVPDLADRAASDPGGSVADRVRVASLACGLVSVLVMVAGLDQRGVEALVLIATLPASDRAVSVARRGWVAAETLADPAALLVRALMARDVMGGDSDVDSDSPVSKVREALALAQAAMADAAVRRTGSAATAVQVPTARGASVDVDLMAHLLDQGGTWVADQGAMAAEVPAADSPAPAALASTAATMMGHRSTTISIAARSSLASMSRRGIAIEHSQVSTRAVAEYAELSTARFFLRVINSDETNTVIDCAGLDARRWLDESPVLRHRPRR